QVALSHTTEKEKEELGAGQFIHVNEEQYNLRLSYKVDWLDSHQLRVGVDLQQTDVDFQFDAIPYYCTDHDPDCRALKGDRIQDKDTLTNRDIAIYVDDNWVIDDSFELALGLRAEHNNYTKQSFVHPRATLSWYPTAQLTLRTKAGTYSRFPDVETVLKKIGNPDLRSPKATHYSIGLEYDINQDWQTSVDVYHKNLGELPLSITEGQPNADLRYSDDLSGTAKGVEWVVRRSLKDGWYGWASLSWSKSDRTDDITNVTTEYYLDTPLLANVVANYKLNDRWDFGLRFTLRSGAKYTPITGLRNSPDHEGSFLANYGELNSKTLPTYHRLDLQANYSTTLWGYD
ncbi:MAG: TonB-dependent receptor, partial [Psychrosphaera sp.]|nr:TonB-dependent receptor [Psychrosphaera sp.]